MQTDGPSALLEWMAAHPLGAHVSARRRARMAAVLARRLTSVSVVAENLYDPHNVSAIVRTAEGFGLDRLHVVEQPNPWRKNPAILRGADRWVSIVRHRGLTRCLSDLMADGFLLCVADVGAGCVPVDEIPVDQKVAIVLGSERDGLSARAKRLADVRFTVPMAGFTESFNVSVSAAVTLFSVTSRRRAILPGEGELSFEEQCARAARWMHQSVRNADEILARLAADRARA